MSTVTRVPSISTTKRDVVCSILVSKFTSLDKKDVAVTVLNALTYRPEFLLTVYSIGTAPTIPVTPRSCNDICVAVIVIPVGTINGSVYPDHSNPFLPKSAIL